MKATFSSWQEFFNMGGDGASIWWVVAVTLATFALLLLHTLWQGGQLRRSLGLSTAAPSHETAADHQELLLHPLWQGGQLRRSPPLSTPPSLQETVADTKEST